MNEVLSAIHARRSVKKFKPDAVPAELIEQIVSAGIQAASGMNRQSPIVVAVTEKAARDALAKVNAEIRGVDSDTFYGAPAVLVVLADRNVPTHVHDGSLVMGNMLLAAHALGLGACWIHRAKETFEKPEWQQWLKQQGVEGDYVGIGNCILGYADVEPQSVPRRENRVFYVK